MLDSGPSAIEDIDWDRMRRRAERNRVAPLLYRALESADGLGSIPAPVRDGLKRSYSRSFQRASLFLEELGPVLSSLREADVPCVVLRGPALGSSVYGDVALRPFTDIDLFVPPQDVRTARQCLEGAGCSLSESRHGAEYFEKYHLHLLYTRQPSGAAFELHWALDHRYTPYTIDPATVVEESKDLALPGVVGRWPGHENNLICNAVHLVKHACFLPYTRDPAKARQRILDSGNLVLLCDIALEIERFREEIDWGLVLRRSREWNATDEVALVLQRTRDLFGCRVPVPGLDRMANRGRPIARVIYHLVAGTRGRGRLAHTRPQDLFRPVRTLDLVRYVLPGLHYLRRRYRLRSTAAAVFMGFLHPFVAFGELTANFLAWRRE